MKLELVQLALDLQPQPCTTMVATPTLLLGTANFGPEGGTPWYTHHTQEAAAGLLDAWTALGGKCLDTAAVYGVTDEWGTGGSERLLKSVGATGGKFVLDTKAMGFGKGTHGGIKVRESLEKSLRDLGVAKVNIFYLHAPDRETPFKYVLEQLDTLYREGKFAKLGLSNYSGAEVQEFCDLAVAHDLIKPSVYQGNYSALCRGGEGELFPVLRKNGMSFYAYSPLAMGMLTGGPHKESLEAARALPAGSRFHPDSRKASVFQGEWFKPEIFAAVRLLNSLATDAGIAPVQASLRWIAHHSALSAELGDGIIVGALSPEQLEETVHALELGPLDKDTAAGFAEMWKLCAVVAPSYYMPAL